MPFLCSGIWFSPKLSYHRIISLAVFLPMLSFSFYQKTYNYNSNVNPAIAAERSRASVLLSPQKSFGVGDPSLKLIKATRCHISNIGNYIHCWTFDLPFPAMSSFLVIFLSFPFICLIHLFRCFLVSLCLIYFFFIWSTCFFLHLHN